MTSLPAEKLNALRLGRPLTVEVPARSTDRRAWVAIYPEHDTQNDRAAAEQWTRGARDRTFNVLHREFDRVYIDQDLWCGPGDGMWEVRAAYCESEERLLELLADWQVDASQAEFVHRSEYPV